MRTLIQNCRIVSPGLDLDRGSVLLVDGSIGAVGPDLPAGAVDRTVDGEGLMLMPGFIDIHTHGCCGCDVTDGSVESIRKIAAAKLREGVTTFLPTTLTLPQAPLLAAARAVEGYRNGRKPGETKAAGLHVEGPFINPKCVGAQNPAHVRAPDLREIEAIAAITPVAVVSVAAEMEGGMEFIRGLTEKGIASSLAHTAATFAQFVEAKAAGLRHLTHFCNQMTPLHHREIGIVGAGLIDPDIMLELICDGIHLCDDMLRLIWATKGGDRLMLITDSMAASWMGDGTLDLGGLAVNVVDGVARLTSGALAGSTLRYNDGLGRVARLTGQPLSRLVGATSWNQARSLGLDGVGRIEPGWKADLVLLSRNYEVVGTWVDGVATVF